MVASAYRRISAQRMAPHARIARIVRRRLLRSKSGTYFRLRSIPGVDPVHPDDAGPGDGTPMMLGSTSLALIAVIGIPMTIETMASANCRRGRSARPPAPDWPARPPAEALRRALPQDPLPARPGSRRHTRCIRAQVPSVLRKAASASRRNSSLGLCGAPILRLHRIGRCGIQRVWLSLRILLGIVLGRVVLRGIVLGWVVLRRVVLGRMRLGGRPLLRGLGHVHRIGDGC